MRCRLYLSTAILWFNLLHAAEPLRTAQRHLEDCLPGAKAEFTFVEVVSGPEAIRDRINTAIRERLKQRPRGGIASSPEECARKFVGAYRDGAPWSLSKSVKVLRATPPVFTIEYSEWSYTGNARASLATEYLNFDAETGEIVKLCDLLAPDAVDRLTTLAESRFRGERGLGAAADLRRAGFRFPSGRFTLPANYGLGESSIIFAYNIFEIAPFAQGAATIEIPYAEICDLLKPGVAP